MRNSDGRIKREAKITQPAKSAILRLADAGGEFCGVVAKRGAWIREGEAGLASRGREIVPGLFAVCALSGFCLGIGEELAFLFSAGWLAAGRQRWNSQAD